MNALTWRLSLRRCLFSLPALLLLVCGATAQTTPVPPPDLLPAPGFPTVAPPPPSAADQAVNNLQAQARTLEKEAAAQARSGQLARAQLLYGQAAVLYHREARLARQQAQALSAAGNASGAASRHTLALAADNHFLRSMASEVALIKKQAALSASAVRAVKPVVKPAVRPRPTIASLPAPPSPAVTAVAPAPPVPPVVVRTVKRPPVRAAVHPLVRRVSFIQRPVLVSLRARAVSYLKQAAALAARPHRPAVRPRPTIVTLPPPFLPLPPPPSVPESVLQRPVPPIEVAAPAAAPIVSPLVSAPWAGVQEVFSDRAFEHGAPVLLQISGLWTFRPDGTWQREVRTANGVVFPAHGTYTVAKNTLTLVTRLDAGGTQTTVYHYSVSEKLQTLLLVTDTRSGYERYLLYAQGTETRPRRPEDLDALAPNP